MVDVGGANGSVLHMLQEPDPDLRGIVLDRPNVRRTAVVATRSPQSVVEAMA